MWRFRSLRHRALLILDIALIRSNRCFEWVHNFNRINSIHFFDVSIPATKFLLFDLFFREHHRHSSPEYHVKTVSIISMLIYEVTFLKELVLKILDHLKKQILLEVLVLKKVYVAQKFIDLIIIDLLQGDLHLARYYFNNSINSVRIMRIFIEVERSESLLLGKDKSAVNDYCATHWFFSHSSPHQISPSHHPGCSLLRWI